MCLTSINFSDCNKTASILEALRSDDETHINDTDTESGGEAATGTSSHTVDHNDSYL